MSRPFFIKAALAAVALVLLGVSPLPIAAGTFSATDRTAAALARVRDDRPELMHFLERMPKGADLHHHLTGAVYAESYIRYAVEDGDCIDGTTFTIVAPPCAPANGTFPAARAQSDFVFRSHTIDALSARDFVPSPSDADIRLHFFAAFDKFDVVTNGHWGEMFAEVVARAAAQNEIYLETMLTPDQGEVIHLAAGVPWNDDFATLRSTLLAAGMAKAVADGRANLDAGEQKMHVILGCGTPHAGPGCNLTLRFQYQVLRAFPKTSVFAQMLAGFEMASVDSRVVAINLVQSQDEYNALNDFGLQMRMLDYFHRVYPNVHISLHAGELTPGEVTPEEMRASHIRQSIELGHAERIGHGLDVVYEQDPPALLAELARKHILVEDCLYSHELVRGMRGRDNVLPIYLRAGVPVALATDDEGVTRADLTTSFVRAVEGYGVGYKQLKTMVRDSLDHAFVPGPSLWRAPENFTVVPACARMSAACSRFLATSERARLEWREELAFARFESAFCSNDRLVRAAKPS
jgi:adenosine deaminase